MSKEENHKMSYKITSEVEIGEDETDHTSLPT